jgi:hypothetical protein
MAFPTANNRPELKPGTPHGYMAPHGSTEGNRAMERPGRLVEQGIRIGRRQPLEQEELDSSPRRLRENLGTLDGMLSEGSSDVRRRVRLAFGELVANWQLRFSGDKISVLIESLPDDAVRMNIRHPERMLTSGEWDFLVSPVVAGLVDDWGIDRRMVGRAWFEFQ